MADITPPEAGDYKAQVIKDLFDPDGVLSGQIDMLWRIHAQQIPEGYLLYLIVKRHAISILIASIRNQPEFMIVGQGQFKLYQRILALQVIDELNETEIKRENLAYFYADGTDGVGELDPVALPLCCAPGYIRNGWGAV